MIALLNPFGQYPGDSSYALNSTLLHFEGANNSTTIVDSSARPKTYTAVGDAKLTTARAQFGSTSLALDGTGDYLTAPYDAEFDFGNSEFTIEASVWINAAPAGDSAICSLWKVGALSWFFGIDTSRRLTFYRSLNGTSGDFSAITTGFTVPTGQWSQVCASRAISGGFETLSLYIDGTRRLSPLTATQTYANQASNSVKFGVGGHDGGGGIFTAGNIDELRVTKGVARRTGASYTPDTVAFPDA